MMESAVVKAVCDRMEWAAFHAPRLGVRVSELREHLEFLEALRHRAAQIVPFDTQR